MSSASPPLLLAAIGALHGLRCSCRRADACNATLSLHPRTAAVGCIAASPDGRQLQGCANEEAPITKPGVLNALPFPSSLSWAPRGPNSLGIGTEFARCPGVGCAANRRRGISRVGRGLLEPRWLARHRAYSFSKLGLQGCVKTLRDTSRVSWELLGEPLANTVHFTSRSDLPMPLACKSVYGL